MNDMNDSILIFILFEFKYNKIPKSTKISLIFYFQFDFKKIKIN